MKIRRAKLKDLNNIYNLMKSNKELKKSTNSSYFNKNFLKTIIKGKETLFIVAENNKKIVGILGAAIWKKARTSYADFIFVDKIYRGQGVGTELHKYFIKVLRNLRISYVWAIVKSNDHAMQKVFNRFKFKKQYQCYYYGKILK